MKTQINGNTEGVRDAMLARLESLNPDALIVQDASVVEIVHNCCNNQSH